MMRVKLKSRDFTILSQNCIGGVFYHDMGMEFLTPTINLHFRSEDFIKFIHHLEYYLEQPMIMRWGELFPEGKLDDITIYFNHFNNCHEAMKKWDQRKKRINKKKIVVICTDRDGFGEREFEQLKESPYPWILFSGLKFTARTSNVIFYPQYKGQSIGNIIDNRRFYIKGKLVTLINKL